MVSGSNRDFTSCPLSPIPNLCPMKVNHNHLTPSGCFSGFSYKPKMMCVLFSSVLTRGASFLPFSPLADLLLWPSDLLGYECLVSSPECLLYLFIYLFSSELSNGRCSTKRAVGSIIDLYTVNDIIATCFSDECSQRNRNCFQVAESHTTGEV